MVALWRHGSCYWNNFNFLWLCLHVGLCKKEGCDRVWMLTQGKHPLQTLSCLFSAPLRSSETFWCSCCHCAALTSRKSCSILIVASSNAIISDHCSSRLHALIFLWCVMFLWFHAFPAGHTQPWGFWWLTAHTQKLSYFLFFCCHGALPLNHTMLLWSDLAHWQLWQSAVIH